MRKAVTGGTRVAPAHPCNTILIVDGQPDKLAVVADRLTALGYRPVPVRDGAEALARVDAVQPDLILLGAALADMDGLEVCRQLKARAGTAQIPVIFMAGRQDAASQRQALALGAVDCVRKPLRMDELAARVGAQLQLRLLRRGVHEAVEARTAELRESNRRLQFELAERRAAELALAASTLGYQEIFDYAADALYLIEGGEDGQFRYVQVNPAFARLAGMPAAGIPGQRVSQLFGAGRRRALAGRLPAPPSAARGSTRNCCRSWAFSAVLHPACDDGALERCPAAPAAAWPASAAITRLHDYQLQLNSGAGAIRRPRCPTGSASATACRWRWPAPRRTAARWPCCCSGWTTSATSTTAPAAAGRPPAGGAAPPR
ncbi:response regulator [Duganella sp. BJB1802]|nr:response regulator [Duganella sp. BJB1802]NVD73760.1 response regulator [Duganella sp. BJB1802]